MSHKMLRPFIVKVSVLGYFPLIPQYVYLSLIFIISMIYQFYRITLNDHIYSKVYHIVYII